MYMNNNSVLYTDGLHPNSAYQIEERTREDPPGLQHNLFSVASTSYFLFPMAYSSSLHIVHSHLYAQSLVNSTKNNTKEWRICVKEANELQDKKKRRI